MKYYFVEKTHSFYLLKDEDPTPEDSVELDQELFIEASRLVKGFEKKIRIVGNEIVVLENPTNKEELAEEAKRKRNILLQSSDWTMMPDAPFTKAQKDAWKEYRQALRDITEQEGFPENVVFPDPPAKE